MRMEPSYPPGIVAELLGISVDTVRRWADGGTLAMTRDDAGRRRIDGAALAAFLIEHAPDIHPDRFSSQSARNRLPGIVTRVTKDTVMAKVEMQAGPHRIVSLMTAEAADELGLAPGVVAVATVKSTNVIVERPDL